MDKQYKTGILITILGAICWGFSGCFAQYLFDVKRISAEWLVSIRLIFAGIILICMGFASQKGELLAVFKDKVDLRQLLYFSIFGMLLVQYTSFSAIEYSNAGTAMVLQSLNPMVILVVVCVKEMRPPSKLEVVAMTIALVGIFLLSTRGNIHNMILTNRALFLGLASAVFVAVYNLLSVRILKKYGTYAIVGFGMLFAGLIMAAITPPWRYEIVWDTGTIWAVAGVTLIGTAIAFSLYLKGVSMVGSFMGSLLSGVEPVTTIIVSILFLGSEFHPIELVGAVMILGTVFVLSYYSGKEDENISSDEVEVNEI
ncbi:MAG: EamA family transporter [Anaerotignum sp.]